ncbi:hypothetical protein CgunFtcFv8_025801 [Champsocephalus gunnari]|uniref:Uncharacterized protein n=1 Tax=Champsocephalus gunnari TaxID=52237 RepID=A0AAN8H630_CHAGU|nr:hypothetical protein CgunFtcFv8_025801 [Champsocephalus gunnari]
MKQWSCSEPYSHSTYEKASWCKR